VPTVRLLLASAFLLTACGSTSKKITNIGTAVPGATYLPVYLAVDDGLFVKEGLEPNVVEFRGGADLIKALVAGSLDVGIVGLAEVTAGIDAGQPLKAFYGGFNVPDFDWYATGAVKTIEQAKGKRIGITQYGTTTDFLTRYVLAAHNMDPVRDAQIVQSGPGATRLAAMEAGQLDVAIFSSPDKFIAADRGYTRIYSQKQAMEDYPTHVFVATEAFLANNPNVIRSLLRAHVSAIRLARSDRPHAEAVLTKRLQLDPKHAPLAYDGVMPYTFEDGRLPKALPVFFDIGIKNGRYKEAWPASKYWMPLYVDTYNQWKPS
jgi:NitT/TauT family transport system substrate-binding protein